MLTPSTLRLDLKCGKGAISKGEKCHKGAATVAANEKPALSPARLALAGAAAGVAVSVILNRKKWTEAATKVWQSATPFEPANPPKGAEYLSQGNNGTIYLAKDRKSIVKIPKNRKALIGLDDEVATQIKLHEGGVSTPKIYHYGKQGNGIIHMEFLDGYKPLSSSLKGGTPEIRSLYARKFTNELRRMHALGIAHGDLNYNNVLVKDSNLSMIDFGFSGPVTKKGTGDIGNLIRMAKDLDPPYAAILKDEYKGIQAKISANKPLTPADFEAFYQRVENRTLSRGDSMTTRLDLKCGKGAISKGERCHKGTASSVTHVMLTAGAVGLGLGIAKAVSRPRPLGTSRRPSPSPDPSGGPITPVRVRVEQPRLTGTTPRALLRGSTPRKSKTQRMRENTAAAMRQAEGAIAQTAREEVRRIAQIGNTMGTVGEATGMATKTALRELRLRTEAARRRFEPGYKKGQAPAVKPPAQLPEGGTSAFQLPVSAPTPLTPEALEIDPRTGQPRRRRPQGFGRGDSGMQFLHSQYVDPARQRKDGPSTEYYRTHPEARAKKVRHQAKINARPSERARRAALNKERRARGIDGKGGPDISHTVDGKTVLEDPSTNRARNGHGKNPRLKSDALTPGKS